MPFQKPMIKSVASTSPQVPPPLPIPDEPTLMQVDDDDQLEVKGHRVLKEETLDSHEKPEDVASSWLESYMNGVFTSEDILKYKFRAVVPLLLAPRTDSNCLKLQYDEEQIRIRLIEPLERFLSNNDNPEDFLKSLSVIDKPESFCGHVFSLGEPTYACRDCGLDPTCVLCANCFKTSAHRNHRYKISNSSGGGYCDCGDAEAWKKDVYCEVHGARIGDINSSSLPADVLERARKLFDIIISYCYERLSEPFRTNLPASLTMDSNELGQYGLKGLNEVYCTILYNDETHTFENVIQTLTRALGCSKKDAIEYASFIDREGRCILKCSTFNECSKISDLIDRYSSRNGGKPLVDAVVPVIGVAHELFAIRLLSWVQKVVLHSAGYREAFYQAMIKRPLNSEVSILEGVMLNDTTIWKSGRAVWHHLFATGLLKDYNTKKNFAMLFIKHYVEMMKDFISDDHDHAFSITALSVQILTVPSIAHYLMENADAFYLILRSFMTECESRRGPGFLGGRLEFERSAIQGPFKRTSFSTLDLKYLLTAPPAPEAWTEDFKRHFLHGFSELMRLLGWMQEMDSQVRLTVTHMEYESEWETAFNIFIKLAPVMALVVEWCTTKKSILIRAYRSILVDTTDTYTPLLTKKIKRRLVNEEAECYVFDVACEPVSIHLPVSRLWAAVHLRLSQYSLDYFSSEFDIPNKPSPAMLIEPVLRGQVLAAQINAGMWKRNGYAILNQLFFYRNVRCRSDMFDKDILALQTGASILPSDTFLIHALNRFDLLGFVERPAFEAVVTPENDQMKQMCILLEDFLGLVINVVSARFTPGVGMVSDKDCTRKEVIQLLCVKPMTHSSITKSMVEDANYETGVEHVLDDVAVTRKQTEGLIYELKPELERQYDIFYYHYTREQMSCAENRQHLLKRERNDPEFFPPPPLPFFAPTYERVVDILNSNVLLHICSVVITRSRVGLNSFLDAQLRRAFHLIGYGLNEEITQRDAGKENHFKFCEAAVRHNLFNLLNECLRDGSIKQHHHMIRWLLSQRSIIESTDLVVPEETLEIDDAAIDNEATAKRKLLAAEAKARMLAKMNTAQNEFRAINAELFNEDEPMLEAPTTVTPGYAQESVCLGPNQTPRPSANESYTCIFCQETQLLNEASGLALPVFIQRSTVDCQDRAKLVQDWRDKVETKHSWGRDTLFMHPDLLVAPYVSCCGHVMHSSCWQRHFETVLLKERRRPYRLRHLLAFDVERNEYLCPMCQCICNAVMPMVAPSHDFFPPLEVTPISLSEELPENWKPEFSEWYDMCCLVAERAIRHPSEYLPTDPSYIEFCAGNEFEYGSRPDLKFWNVRPLNGIMMETTPDQQKVLRYFFPRAGRGLLRDELMELTTLFIHSMFTKVANGTPGSDGEFRFAALTWQAIAFTIMNNEASHRDQSLPFFGKDVSARNAASMNYTVLAGSLVSVFCQLYDTDILQSTALVRLDVLIPTSEEALTDILKVDAFALLVGLTYSMPALFLDNHHRRPLVLGNLQDFFILQAVTIMHMVQVILVADFREFITMEDQDSGYSNSQEELLNNLDDFPHVNFVNVCVTTWKKAGKEYAGAANVDWKGVYSHVCMAMVPYLRCCSKFFECLTGIPPPKSLESIESRFGDLTRYLGLPDNLDIYCQYRKAEDLQNLKLHSMGFSLAEQEIMEGRYPCEIPDWSWNQPIPLSYLRFLDEDPAGIRKLATPVSYTYPRKMPKLIDLPEDYTELLNSASDFSCRTCGNHECRIPTMCLICGEILCSQSYCCQDDLKGILVGACTFHSYFCGGSSGIFLRIRECKVFFLGGRGKGCFVAPPYLDEYGETDQGMRRGNPLKLCKEKYEEYRRLWMFHKLQDEIATTTESLPTLIPTDWHLL